MFELFTDFNVQHSPRYFYARGAIWGIVATLICCHYFKYLSPIIRKIILKIRGRK